MPEERWKRIVLGEPRGRDQRQAGFMTGNMRNIGVPQLMWGGTFKLRTLGWDLNCKNSFCTPSTLSSPTLEAEFSLPGAIRHLGGDRLTSAATGWEEGATARRVL